MKKFDLNEYLSGGVEKIVKGAIRASFSNPKESLFMTRFLTICHAGAQKRKQSEKQGEHIPPFLIASITSQCNLHCAGCYARANHACHDGAAKQQLTAAEWSTVFEEAEQLGINFILLAGGEPMVRRDVIDAAAQYRKIIFPVFTNGTMINSEYLQLFDRNRNLVPILSIEGEEEMTDRRRGEGVYRRLQQAMDEMQQKGILFGASITVTTENLQEVASDEFLHRLEEQGCKVVIYVEYVPVNEQTSALAPGDQECSYLEQRLAFLRQKLDEMVFVSFPGDEKTSGGCLAAGRGFFHINAQGSAEPCPFSPYSDTSILKTGLRGALNSPLFQKLQSQEFLMNEHVGGCVLFEQRQEVEQLIQEGERKLG